MDGRLRDRMIFHGGLVIFLGLLAGFPYAFVVTGDLEGEVRAWRMAHLEGVLNGMLVIAVAAAAARFKLSARKQSLLAWSLILMAYGNFVASVLGASFGVRGLAPAPPAMNLIVYGLFMLAVVGIFIGIGLVVQVARSASRS